ncbi:PREDICTED: uncharacterized protein LOC108551700 [Eufriesea mexicana]|uniref:uncharacterized protein LOC108551700 n=1 Tax=Eufriesea mexicana TaxID=516756 RepID=UPI00083BED5D|nr:PREDICTED: uncharacterized protein LOC108551700 [Eufriesea mexicana]
MNSNESYEPDIKIEIQKTLFSINGMTSKIKNELNVINDLVKKNGQLHTAVVDANEILTTVAKNMDIDVKNVLSDNENGNTLQFNLRNAVSSADFQEKILTCLNNM